MPTRGASRQASDTEPRAYPVSSVFLLESRPLRVKNDEGSREDSTTPWG